MKNFFQEARHKKIILIAGSLAVLIAAVLTFQALTARGAVYGFAQTDWSGGEDALSTLTHLVNQSGWTKYFSKTSNVKTDVNGQISLTSTTSNFVNTSDADFNAGTKTNVYVASGSIAILKPLGVACLANDECGTGWCRDAKFCTACETVSYGGNSYATEVVGNQCWLKTALNIGTLVASINQGVPHSEQTNNGLLEKYCYNNSEANCTSYGGLYDWDEAMLYSTSSGAKGICPTGWHIPSDTEWGLYENTLKGASCNTNRVDAWDCEPAGTNLKNGPLFGDRNPNGVFENLNFSQSFWSSTNNGTTAWVRGIQSNEARIYRQTALKNYGFAVRCLKD